MQELFFGWGGVSIDVSDAVLLRQAGSLHKGDPHETEHDSPIEYHDVNLQFQFPTQDSHWVEMPTKDALFPILLPNNEKTDPGKNAPMAVDCEDIWIINIIQRQTERGELALRKKEQNQT